MSIQPVQRYNIYPKDVSKELYQKEENVKLPYICINVTHIILIYRISAFLKVETDIITGMAASLIGRVVIMHVSSRFFKHFKRFVFIYLNWFC